MRDAYLQFQAANVKRVFGASREQTDKIFIGEILQILKDFEPVIATMSAAQDNKKASPDYGRGFCM
jgi:hypothetical protein